MGSKFNYQHSIANTVGENMQVKLHCGARTRALSDRSPSHLDVGPLLGHLVRAAQASRAGADDDDVGLGVRVHVLEVARRHGAADLRCGGGRWGVKKKAGVRAHGSATHAESLTVASRMGANFQSSKGVVLRVGRPAREGAASAFLNSLGVLSMA